MSDAIALIEELAANAVPAAVSQEIDGWRMRFNMGATRRANSALAARHGHMLSLEERLALAEAFYARHGLPCRFQICPASRPDGLAETLLARGYRAIPGAYVQACDIGQLRAGAAGRAQISAQLSDAWLGAYVEGEGETSQVKIAARCDMLLRIGPASGFAAIEEDGQIAAVAFGVVERGWLGIFNVATRPSFRRRGLSRVLLGDLAAWAVGLGAAQAYLQVSSANAPALGLYAGLGFRTCYEYTYYEQEVAAWAG